MANSPVKQSDISKKELMDAYSNLKARTKRANEIARKEGETMMNHVLTVGSALGTGWVYGDMAKKATKGMAPGSAAYDAAAKKSYQVGGIDYDLILGGGALAAGMMKWGGKFSPTLSAIGTGALAGFAHRAGTAMGKKSKA